MAKKWPRCKSRSSNFTLQHVPHSTVKKKKCEIANMWFTRLLTVCKIFHMYYLSLTSWEGRYISIMPIWKMKNMKIRVLGNLPKYIQLISIRTKSFWLQIILLVTLSWNSIVEVSKLSPAGLIHHAVFV